MKVAKYLFLLLLLLAGTISVFVATKDGNYTIKHEQIIEVPKDIAYKYFTNPSNWDSINPWKGENFKIVESKNNLNQSIIQKVLLNDVVNDLRLEFHDTLSNKTNAIWFTQGQLTFKDKFLSIIGRGAKNDFEDRFKDALTFVNKTLIREINNFNFKLDGFVKRDTVYYIQKPIVSTKEQIPTMIKHFVPKLEKILSSTNTKTKGAPFLIYHQKDSLKNQFKYSIAVPTEHKIFLSSDSDIINGQIDPSSTIKATIKGNYRHLAKAYTAFTKFMDENKLEKSYKFKEIEVLVKTAITEKSASNLVTELYFPVKPKKTVVKIKSIKKDSLTNITPSTPTN
ncbi:GyrI-like domain-containing protein [Flavobacterium sp.]|uniref:GyrI-like domain-containing protein n=1 Tax=Flavobacterium sp. TaxID=239 RepID=UPI003D0D87E5